MMLRVHHLHSKDPQNELLVRAGVRVRILASRAPDSSLYLQQNPKGLGFMGSSRGQLVL